MEKELEKVYQPKDVENRTYEKWMENGYFTAKIDPERKPYTIIMPPPNVTGQLHMGHALDVTVQDVLIRFKRMQGYSALWLPGTDHAAIATEVKIVEKMAEEGFTKDDVGRDGFMERAWAWTEKYGNTIVEQQMRLGASCDWSRERFTLDEGCSKAVNQAFYNLYKKGLIYRGERMINWCPTCETSLSDAEVEFLEKEGYLWQVAYPIKDSEEKIVVSTSRPETLFGDMAVAVHPEDPRYKNLIGKIIILPLVGREIPIIADTYVDMEFGTGAVKITPAHDPNDFEVGVRHNLEVLTVINEDGTLNAEAGQFQGMDREVARKAVVAALEEQGYLESTEEHVHNVGTCYRCHSDVEPRVSLQWFVEMVPLAKPAIDAVNAGDTHFIPPRFKKTYDHWMENIKDWCISRQLWWGHQIPAWYCDDCGHTTVSTSIPTECEECHSTHIHRDEDTLDTWFSSALWPFSTLGWPDKTPDFEYFYPTSTLVTAYDIIFFWVARMIFSALEQTGEVPFQDVLIHGLIRDSQGRKMSKSLGNGIDPLDMVDQYGADALRFALASGNSPGNDMRFSDEKVLSSRNFTNKIWNAARFVLMNMSEGELVGIPTELTMEDRWILTKLNRLVEEVTENLEKYELGIALQKIYDFFWDIYCDWYIELCKPRLQAGGQGKTNAEQVLVYVLKKALKLLHPFMPFITEEIYQAIPHTSPSIMVSPWPTVQSALNYPEEEQAFEQVMDAIRAIRNQRAQMNIPPSKKAKVYIETEDVDTFNKAAIFFKRLASASDVEVGTSWKIPDAVSIVTKSARIFIPMDDLVDKEKERERLNKELEVCEKEIAMINGKLGNAEFVNKAPEAIVNKEREKLADMSEKMEKIKESIAEL